MKKAVALFLLLAGLAAAFFKLGSHKHVHGAQLAPAECALFVEFPDLRGSAMRWQKTGLNALLKEKEVQACLTFPDEKILKRTSTGFAKLKDLNPSEAFLAFASLDPKNPKVLAGIGYSGKRDAFENLLDELKSDLRKSYPEIKTQTLKHNQAKIQAFSNAQFFLAVAFSEDWFLAATDLELLTSALDRLTNPSSPNLGKSALFTSTVSKMPAEREILAFAPAQAAAKEASNLVSILNETQWQIPDLEAITATVAFNGPLMRDTVFVRRSNKAESQPLARHSLGLSSTDTLLYYTVALQTELFPSSDPNIAELRKALGPEVSVLLDWPTDSSQPLFVLSLDVRDPSRASQALDSLSSGSSACLSRKQEDGSVFYTLARGTPLFSPVTVLKDGFLMASFSREQLDLYVRRALEKPSGLLQTPSYTSASTSLETPSIAFGFADGQRLVERTYDALRPALMMMAGFSPQASKYLEASKIPSTATLSKHFSPMVLSSWSREDGSWMQSNGTITFTQSAGLILTGALAAAINYRNSLVPNDLYPQNSTSAPTPAPAAPSLDPNTPQTTKEAQPQKDASNRKSP